MPATAPVLVSSEAGDCGIVEGTYQSPILVQWQQAPRSTRVLDVTLSELI